MGGWGLWGPMSAYLPKLHGVNREGGEMHGKRKKRGREGREMDWRKKRNKRPVKFVVTSPSS